jgi:hypothetical protein
MLHQTQFATEQRKLERRMRAACKANDQEEMQEVLRNMTQFFKQNFGHPAGRHAPDTPSR